MFLTRDAILACQDQVIEKLHVPAWGGDLYVKSLSGTERDRFEASNIIRDKKNNTFDVRAENLRARLVALSVCDENGKRLFSDADVKELGVKNAQALALVYDVAARLSGITKADIEEIAKNSLAGDGETSA